MRWGSMLGLVLAAGQAWAAPSRAVEAGPAGGRVAGVPVVEVPAAPGSWLALLVSGDGGWAPIDKGVARALAQSGVAVVGIDARTYLARRRTPDAVAADMARVLRYYLERWNRDRVVLVGYSRGADLAPFIVNRLPDDLRARVGLVAMLGIGQHAGFHVSLLDLFRSTSNPSDPPTLPEVEAAHRAGIPLLCVYGVDEKESLCRDAGDSLMVRIATAGAHHFDGDHAGLAADILSHLKSPSSGSDPIASGREPVTRP